MAHNRPQTLIRLDVRALSAMMRINRSGVLIECINRIIAPAIVSGAR
jgi:hypothetical protein